MFICIFADDIQRIAMNNVTISMNNVLGIIHSMSLTASNKQWLAEKLIEEARTEKQTRKTTHDITPITEKDLTIAPQVARLFSNVPPMPATYDIKKEYTEFLCEKYQ